MMFGRRGIRRVESERELNPYRQALLRDVSNDWERGARPSSHYLAHNMTGDGPGNMGQVAEVISDCRDMGFRMFSFQPAAFIGNTSRWRGRLRGGHRRACLGRGRARRRRPNLPWNAFQIGDEPLQPHGPTASTSAIATSSSLDDRDPHDLAGARRLLRGPLRGNGLRGARTSCPWLARVFAGLPPRHRGPARLGAPVRSPRRPRPAGAPRRPADHLRDALVHGRRATCGRAWALAPAWRGCPTTRRVRATQERLQSWLVCDGAPRSRTRSSPRAAQHSVLASEGEPGSSLRLAADCGSR